MSGEEKAIVKEEVVVLGEDDTGDLELLLRALSLGKVCLVSGVAGCGKSHLLRRLKEELPDCVCVAPTALAAQNIPGAMTLHKALNMGLMTQPFEDLLRLAKRRCYKFLVHTRVLIIDEISMLPATLFEKVEYLFRKMRNSDKVFGGLQLVMFGDFCQLPPINDQFVFQSPVWARLDLFRLVLNRCYRQGEAREFAAFLQRLRFGQLLPSDARLYLSPSTEVEETNLLVSPYRKQVEAHNRKELAKLEETPVFHPPCFHIKGTGTAADLKKIHEYKSSADKYFPVTSVRLARGAKVMMRVNSQEGVVNGSVGTVISFDGETCKVRFSGVDFLIKRHVFVQEAGSWKLTLTQFPLSLAWACTIHQVQGQTIRVPMIIDAANCFEVGQLYVACSRVTRPDHLIVKNFNFRSVKSNADAVEFESKYAKA